MEPLGSSGASDLSSVVSQFVSIDQSGLVILWMTSQDLDSVRTDDAEKDHGLSPWSTVKLVRNRILSLASTDPKRSGFNSNIYAVNPVLASIPADRSMFLLSGHDGKVCKMMRYGEPLNPKYFDTPTDSRIEFEFALSQSNREKNRNNQKEVRIDSYHPAPTCISVGNATIGPHLLILVGRCNGVVDLFQSNESSPIYSWHLSPSDLEIINGSKGRILTSKEIEAEQKIVLVRWIPHHVTSFIVVNGSGTTFYFDLLRNTEEPLLRDKIGVQSLNPATIDISGCRTGSTTAFMAVGAGSDDSDSGHLRLRKLWDGLLLNSKSMEEEENELQVTMPSWIGRNGDPHVAQIINVSGDGFAIRK